MTLVNISYLKSGKQFVKNKNIVNKTNKPEYKIKKLCFSQAFNEIYKLTEKYKK